MCNVCRQYDVIFVSSMTVEATSCQNFYVGHSWSCSETLLPHGRRSDTLMTSRHSLHLGHNPLFFDGLSSSNVSRFRLFVSLLI